MSAPTIRPTKVPRLHNGDHLDRAEFERRYNAMPEVKKAELIEKLLEFCQSHDGYQAVIRLCQEYSPRTRSEPNDAEPTEVDIGFVYLMKSGRFWK